MNLASLPIVGALFAQGEAKVAQAVQSIKEKIAEFNLTPRRVANFKARVDQLSRTPTVSTNTDDVGVLVSVRSRIAALLDAYESGSRQLDIALKEVQKIQTGSISLAAAALLASTVAAMQQVLASTATIDNTISAIEQRALTPTQYAQRSALGVAPIQTSGFSSLFTPRNIAIGIGVGFILRSVMKKRGRR